MGKPGLEGLDIGDMANLLLVLRAEYLTADIEDVMNQGMVISPSHPSPYPHLLTFMEYLEQGFPVCLQPSFSFQNQFSFAPHHGQYFNVGNGGLMGKSTLILYRSVFTHKSRNSLKYSEYASQQLIPPPPLRRRRRSDQGNVLLPFLERETKYGEPWNLGLVLDVLHLYRHKTPPPTF